jgi:hypothetical protein
LMNKLISRNVRVITLKQHLDVAQHDVNSTIIIAFFSAYLLFNKNYSRLCFLCYMIIFIG